MNDKKICIIGLGYVGLPLAIEFSKKYKTIGFDISKSRIDSLTKKNDNNNEVTKIDLEENIISCQKDFNNRNGLYLCSDIKELENIDVYIITVPTPIDKNNKPDLVPVFSATQTVASILKPGNFVIYESTVYPGLTEKECVPILENISGLNLNKDFYVGYSPERINPGDNDRKLTDIRKITSGSNSFSAKQIDSLYSSIINAGTYLAPSILVAEVAKVIENAQRDINIAYMNELTKIFSLMGINTFEVIEAASTKWNFLNFIPGLVGGHCIGVDPYYLTYKSTLLGYNPEIILSGRKINDSMAKFYSDIIQQKLVSKQKSNEPSKILIAGITFKENCPDTRNSKVIDLIHFLTEYGNIIDVYDPVANHRDVLDEFNLVVSENINDLYDAIILAVPHEKILKINLDKFLLKDGFILDIKNKYSGENTLTI